MINNNGQNKNTTNGGKWWIRHKNFGAGGTGEDAVKHIRKVAFGVMIPTAMILAAIGIGYHAGIDWVDNLFNGKKKAGDGVGEGNLHEPPPIDEEKKAKEDDLIMKNKVMKLLGLSDTKLPTGQPLSMGMDSSSESFNPKPLVGLLVKLGDRLVMVSPSGLGKSILSWMLAIAISEGRTPECMPPETEHANPQKVFLYDGELDDDDVRERYGKRQYSPNLLRFASSKFRTLYYLLYSIYTNTVGLNEDSTVILDNLYALMPTLSSEETRTLLDGLDIIQRRVMAKGHHITIIIVTHTGKDVVGIPQLSDVAGSANISRFAKSEVSLAAIPKHPNLVAVVTNKKRYSDNKDAYILKYSNDGYVHFEFVDKTSNNHIRQVFCGQSKLFDDDKDSFWCTDGTTKAETKQAMQELRNLGYSDRKIGKMTGVSAPTVANNIGSNGKGHKHGGRKPKEY